jgi:SAM-dependent methyltransferase
VSSARFASAQAASFGAAAATYDRGRPGYPEEAVAWLVPPGARRVLDLGAGTGQLTRQLAARGLEVTAVEPSEGMRDQLARSLPSVRVLHGWAEDIPLSDRSVDAVVMAQAWHWVDVKRAVPEVARVLAPAGRLGLIWNIRDEQVSWVAELGRIMHRGSEQDMFSTNPPVGPPFGPIERHDISWINPVTLQTLLDLVRSRSYVITMAPEERESVLARVRDLAARHPELAGRPSIGLPYITRCSRATRGGRAAGRA